MPVKSCHSKACFEAWMNCEDLLVDLYDTKNTLSGKVTKVVDECALICMGTFHALKSHSRNIQRFAVLCVGICEECADVCATLHDETFQQCARVCRECSATMT